MLPWVVHLNGHGDDRQRVRDIEIDCVRERDRQMERHRSRDTAGTDVGGREYMRREERRGDGSRVKSKSKAPWPGFSD